MVNLPNFEDLPDGQQFIPVTASGTNQPTFNLSSFTKRYFKLTGLFYLVVADGGFKETGQVGTTSSNGNNPLNILLKTDSNNEVYTVKASY